MLMGMMIRPVGRLALHSIAKGRTGVMTHSLSAIPANYNQPMKRVNRDGGDGVDKSIHPQALPEGDMSCMSGCGLPC